ncbi:hypothetical protein [Paenibacillus phytohabitans]|uniref:hypothetical protein n=1 Tax=Paenibacillus phytohabitans TaxID=2654978 RepID=UPI001491B283|nr:hypothetical protein [Paenibacillus phytohabitans]
MSDGAVEYVKSERKFFPAHLDHNTVLIIEVMLQDAYRAGYNAASLASLEKLRGESK